MIKTIDTNVSFNDLELVSDGRLIGGTKVGWKQFGTDTLSVWNASSGNSNKQIKFEGYKINHIELLDDQILAISLTDHDYNDNEAIYLINLANYRVIQYIQVSLRLFFMKYEPTLFKGTNLRGIMIVATYKRTILVWRLKDNTILQELKGHTLSITCLEVKEAKNANEIDLIFSGSEDKTIRVWNLNTGECLQTLTVHSNTVTALKVTNDNYLLSGSADNSINVWKFDGVWKLVRTLAGHKAPVTVIKLTQNINQFISGSNDSSIRIWNYQSGECVKVLENKQKVGAIFITSESVLKY